MDKPKSAVKRQMGITVFLSRGNTSKTLDGPSPDVELESNKSATATCKTTGAIQPESEHVAVKHSKKNDTINDRGRSAPA